MSVIDDATLLKMAEAEILGEAKRAALRHSTAGVSGWQPCPKPNKMFLTNTILQTMASNRIHNAKIRKKGDKEFTYKKKERKLLQKKSKADMETNFIYMKPKKNIEKPTLTVKTSKFNKDCTFKSNKTHYKDVKKMKEKCNVKKIKLKNI